MSNMLILLSDLALAPLPEHEVPTQNSDRIG